MKGAVAGAFLLSTLVSTLKGHDFVDNPDVVTDWNPNWNYALNGTDWNFTNCNNSRMQQSPVDLNVSGMDWYNPPKKSMGFTFLPTYKPTTISMIDTNTNFTYTVYGDFGQVFATEASDYQVTQTIKWDAQYIKFHYPSEHTIGGQSFDLEMQIYHQVTYSTSYTSYRKNFGRMQSASQALA